MGKLKLRGISGILIFSMLISGISFLTPFSLNVMAEEISQDSSDAQTLLTDEIKIAEGSTGIFKPEVSVSGDVKRLEFESSDTSILELEETSGIYKALRYGIVTVSVTGYGISYEDNPWDDYDDDNDDYSYDDDNWTDDNTGEFGGNYTGWTDVSKTGSNYTDLADSSTGEIGSNDTDLADSSTGETGSNDTDLADSSTGETGSNDTTQAGDISDEDGWNYVDWSGDSSNESDSDYTGQTDDNSDEFGWNYREWTEDNSNDDKWYDVGQGSDEEKWYDVGQDNDNSQDSSSSMQYDDNTDSTYDDSWYNDWYSDYFGDDNTNEKQNNKRIYNKKKTLIQDNDMIQDNDTYEETLLFQESYIVYIIPDMSNVTLDKTSLSLYIAKGDYNIASTVVKINSSYMFNEDDELTEFSYSSSNENMYIFCELADNVLTIGTSNPGSTTISININGKIFKIKFKVTEVSLSKTSLLLTKGNSTQLKVKGIKIKTEWKSSKSKVVSVSKNGKVKAKKYGNAIISAKVGDLKLGCVVSVTSAKKKKVVLKAINIAKGTYSQEKRMQKGYYDCSSLVWRAYSPQGYYFGDKNYAPVAASVAQYLSKNHKIVKGGLSKKNLQGLKIQAGDLFFETGAKNGRFKGIYHVEMFVGYEFGWFDSSGKAYVYSKWAARPAGYYGYARGLIGRP